MAMSIEKMPVTRNQFFLAPFTPIQMGIAGIILSPFAITVMGMMNWRRLGKPERIWQPLVISFALIIVSAFIATTILLRHILEVGTDLTATFLTSTIISLILTAVIAFTQKADYQAWRAVHHSASIEEQGGCLKILVIIASGIVGSAAWFVAWTAVLYPALLPLIGAVMMAVSPVQTFSNAELTLTYSGMWAAVAFEKEEFCQQEDIECFFVATRLSTSPMTFEVERIRLTGLASLLNGLTNLRDVGEGTWQQIQRQSPKATLDSGGSLQVAGRDAYRLIYTNENTQTMMILIEDGRDYTRFLAQGNASLMGYYRSELDAIVQSIRFD